MILVETIKKLEKLDLVDIQNIKLELFAETMEETIHEMVEMIYQNGFIEEEKKRRLHDELIEREYMCSTGIGAGFAIPHVRTENVSEIVLAVGISTKGLDFNAFNGKPVYIVLMILIPTEDSERMGNIIRGATKILSDEKNITLLRNAYNWEEVRELIKIIIQIDS